MKMKSELIVTCKRHLFDDLDFECLSECFDGGEEYNANVHTDGGVFNVVQIPLQAFVN